MKFRKQKQAKQPKYKIKKLFAWLNQVDRRLLVLVVVVIGGGLYFGYAKITADTYMPIARERGDAYLQSIIDCDFDKLMQAKYGFEIPEANKEGSSQKANFEEGCKEMKSFEHIKTMRAELDKAKLAEIDGDFDVEHSRAYYVDYRLDINGVPANESQQVMRMLVILLGEDSWFVTPGPGSPVPLSQYQQSNM